MSPYEGIASQIPCSNRIWPERCLQHLSLVQVRLERIAAISVNCRENGLVGGRRDVTEVKLRQPFEFDDRFPRARPERTNRQYLLSAEILQHPSLYIVGERESRRFIGTDDFVVRDTKWFESRDQTGVRQLPQSHVQTGLQLVVVIVTSHPSPRRSLTAWTSAS